MSAKSYSRGHEIIYLNNLWVYFDTHESILTERPCKRCGKLPTKEGHDACLGNIPNVVSACCGHGIEKPYIIFKKDCK